MSHRPTLSIRRLVSVAALVVIATAAIACSSSGDSTGSSANSTKSTSTGTAPKAVKTDAVTIKDYAFGPKVITVTTGTKVTWTNTDQFAHAIRDTATGQDGGTNIDPNSSYSHTYAKAGTYPYVCGIHPNMHGTVVVTAS